MEFQENIYEKPLQTLDRNVRMQGSTVEWVLKREIYEERIKKRFVDSNRLENEAGKLLSTFANRIQI